MQSKANSSLNILFINLYFEIGGMETLLLKLVRELNGDGIRCTVLLMEKKFDANLMNELLRFASVKFLSEIKSFTPRAFKNNIGTTKFNYIFCTIGNALVLGNFLNRWIFPDAKLLAGVYQTEIFCQKPDLSHMHRNAINKLFTRGIPHENKFFANEATLAHHEANHGIKFSGAQLVPVIIETQKFQPCRNRIINRRKIVSIGRICDFKTYNFTMIDVVMELRKLGYETEYHIHGDGPEEANLRNFIRQRNADHCVFLHGRLNYDEFSSAIADAFVFVGSGTSVMEAAACYIPSIPAIEYAKSAESYGFISDIYGLSFFEPGLDLPRRKILDLIRYLLDVDFEVYRKIEIDSGKSIQRFSPTSVKSIFIDSLNRSSHHDKFLPFITFQFSIQLLASKIYRIFQQLISTKTREY